MGLRHYTTVEVSLDDFDDDTILQAAEEIAASKGYGFRGRDRETVADLAQAIERGAKNAAFQCLRELVQDIPTLTEAIEIGKRRWRPAAAAPDLLTASEALGAMPDGYCFCSKDRIGDDSKVHEPECAAMRAAIAKARGL